MEGRKEIWYDKSNDTGKEGFHMLGAVCGDIIGSYYEVHCTKDEAFPLFTEESTFTDDSVLTAAVGEAILYNPNPVQGFNAKRERAREYALRYKQYSRRYPGAGFGQDFYKWASNRELTRQHSYANGAAMRVPPYGRPVPFKERIVPTHSYE